MEALNYLNRVYKFWVCKLQTQGIIAESPCVTAKILQYFFNNA